MGRTVERPERGGESGVVEASDPNDVERTAEGFLAYLRHFSAGSPRWEALDKRLADLRRAGVLGGSPGRADDSPAHAIVEIAIYPDVVWLAARILREHSTSHRAAS